MAAGEISHVGCNGSQPSARGRHEAFMKPPTRAMPTTGPQVLPCYRRGYDPTANDTVIGLATALLEERRLIFMFSFLTLQVTGDQIANANETEQQEWIRRTTN